MLGLLASDCPWEILKWWLLLLFFWQAVEAAQLAEDLKVQLEHVQCKLKEIQTCMAENRAAKEKESFNLKRAQVLGEKRITCSPLQVCQLL